MISRPSPEKRQLFATPHPPTMAIGQLVSLRLSKGAVAGRMALCTYMTLRLNENTGFLLNCVTIICIIVLKIYDLSEKE